MNSNMLSSIGWKAILGRLIGYGSLLSLLACLAHLYIAQPLYVKKVPYFYKAFLQGLEVECSKDAPDNLASLLQDVSLPFFSLNGQISYVDSAESVHGCNTVGAAPSNESYRFASMTKVITAFALFELAQKKAIDLETRLVDFFPEVQKGQIQDENLLNVTLNHLLNHSSGFGGPFGSDNMIKEDETPWCPHDLEQMESIRLAGQPGTNHVYSNVAYCLLGEVISRVSGTDYRTYIRENYLAGYDSLEFVDGDYEPDEPDYDFSNDFRLGENYVNWLDFKAISAAAGLMGEPEQFARLIWELNRRHSDLGFSLSVDGCREKRIERCYARGLVVEEKSGRTVGVQQGYLPGVSSLVAISDEGEVLVWVAAGAALESKYKDRMVDRVVSFLSEH